MRSKLLTINILDMIEQYGELKTQQQLSGFSCPKNPKIELFLRKNAIIFARKKISVTYLVYNATNQLLGFFTLAHKAINFPAQGLSATQHEKTQRYAKLDKKKNSYNISAFLLAQLSKNMAINDGKNIQGSDLLECAEIVLNDVQVQIGGGLLYLDFENIPYLRQFYTAARFKYFGTRKSDTDQTQYLQFLKFI